MTICIAVFHHDIVYKPTIVVSNDIKVGDSVKFYFDFGRFNKTSLRFTMSGLFYILLVLVSCFYNMFTLEF